MLSNGVHLGTLPKLEPKEVLEMLVVPPLGGSERDEAVGIYGREYPT